MARSVLAALAAALLCSPAQAALLSLTTPADPPNWLEVTLSGDLVLPLALQIVYHTTDDPLADPPPPLAVIERATLFALPTTVWLTKLPPLPEFGVKTLTIGEPLPLPRMDVNTHRVDMDDVTAEVANAAWMTINFGQLITDSLPYRFVTITSNLGGPTIERHYPGASRIIPEPASWLLVGALLFYRRRH